MPSGHNYRTHHCSSKVPLIIFMSVHQKAFGLSTTHHHSEGMRPHVCVARAGVPENLQIVDQFHQGLADPNKSATATCRSERVRWENALHGYFCLPRSTVFACEMCTFLIITDKTSSMSSGPTPVRACTAEIQIAVADKENPYLL